ncbi:Uncharacterised protein [Burkholderia pseudomallei]|uniref:hypothetical protein n=1 Tax=Burkholderia pseudomallei TaxID=28450 RepID=UPI000F04BF62|nr:hypothetical protein [Burkholderia pseudomallei]CAJ5232680.1 Uncharacterised protein [Burkholderia pseudomallei]CAJ7565277.1 Uncharacterised protein [Burkholderia pseudomallei]CAK0348100.1 Uncharacterised protein [Burkholderia pseudomallei]VCH22766.1 Uncharacterised protein [Burkholderia pseudomallei]VCH61654.1 Uncharacterised protein [Burkholderia pseudomallei]
MSKHIIVLAFSLFASSAFAEVNCNKQGSKAKVERCFKQQIAEKKEALEEYDESITTSSNIPMDVKARVHAGYQSFMRNIYKTCPDLECVNLAMKDQIQDMYDETSQFTVPQ